jgi:hypothetical protein
MTQELTRMLVAKNENKKDDPNGLSSRSDS